MKIKIAQFGLGPIGIETLKLAAGKSWIDVVGAVDIDPGKAGQDLSSVTQAQDLRGTFVYRTIEELLAAKKPDLIFHTAVSRLREALPQIEPMVRSGLDVVSSCEELLFPQLREPALAAKLDGLCRDAGVRVVGTGVNPDL